MGTGGAAVVSDGRQRLREDGKLSNSGIQSAGPEQASDRRTVKATEWVDGT